MNLSASCIYSYDPIFCPCGQYFLKQMIDYYDQWGPTRIETQTNFIISIDVFFRLVHLCTTQAVYYFWQTDDNTVMLSVLAIIINVTTTATITTVMMIHNHYCYKKHKEYIFVLVINTNPWLNWHWQYKHQHRRFRAFKILFKLVIHVICRVVMSYLLGISLPWPHWATARTTYHALIPLLLLSW